MQLNYSNTVWPFWPRTSLNSVALAFDLFHKELDVEKIFLSSNPKLMRRYENVKN